MSTEASVPLFEGLRVIDAASFIAAPTAAMILGDLGADVIKIEPPGEGDPYRVIDDSPALPFSGANHCWIMDSRSKRSLTLNLKSDEGRQILLELVRGADVYITNQPFPVRRRLGLDYEDLAPLNERLVYASLTAFGEKGPERDNGAFDGVAYWARSGLEDLLRRPGEVPRASLPGQGDHPTGVTLYAAIVTALYRRHSTGRGGYVHTSLLANGYWSNGCLGSAALAGADVEEWRDRPADSPGSYTRALFETSDGRYLQLIMVRTEEQAEACLRVAGLGDLLLEERFATAEARGENPLPIIERLTEAIRGRPAEDWLRDFQAAGVPASLVRLTREMSSDPQAAVNDVILEPAEPAEVGVPWVINHPVRIEGAREGGAVRPPAVGEHTDEILGELGYDEARISDLRRDGVL